MEWKITTLIIAAIFAVLYAFIGRYEMIDASGGKWGVAYRLDHWTGEVIFFAGGEVFKLKNEE